MLGNEPGQAGRDPIPGALSSVRESGLAALHTGVRKCFPGGPGGEVMQSGLKCRWAAVAEVRQTEVPQRKMMSGDPVELSDCPWGCDKQTSKLRDGGTTRQKQPGCLIAYLKGAAQESGPPLLGAPELCLRRGDTSFIVFKLLRFLNLFCTHFFQLLACTLV